MLVLAIGVPALLFLARSSSRARARRKLLTRCESIGSQLKRITHPARLEKLNAAGLAGVLSQIENFLREAHGIQGKAEELSLDEGQMEKARDLLRTAQASYGSAAASAAGVARRTTDALARKTESVEEVERLLQALAKLVKIIDSGARFTADDPKTSASLAAARESVTACRDEIRRVEPVTFDALLSRLSSGDRPVCVLELDAWRSNQHRFFFTTKSYETSQLTYSTHTRVEERIAYSLVLRDGPGETHAETWLRLRGDLEALKADVAAVKEEGEPSDEQVEAFAGRARKLAERLDAELDATPGQCLVLQTPDASDFDDEKATTLAEEGEKPSSPWEVPPSILQSAFANSPFGSSLPQIEAAIKRLQAMSEKPVKLDETLPELKPPDDMLLFGEAAKTQQRLFARYNEYARLFNVELRRRTRLELDSWLERLTVSLADAAPEKASERVTLRCRAIDMPDLVREGLAKAIGREPAPFILVEAGKSGK